jgi:exodeoxyribonuclease III
VTFYDQDINNIAPPKKIKKDDKNDNEEYYNINEIEYENINAIPEEYLSTNRSENINNHYLINMKQKSLYDFNFKIVKKYENYFFPFLFTHQCLNICSWNIRGLRAMLNKGSNLHDFIEKENPDILCLIDTKLNEPTLRGLKFLEEYQQRYTHYYNLPYKEYQYCGIIVLSKHKAFNVMYGTKHHIDMDGRVLTLDFNKFYLVCVYVPYSRTNEMVEQRESWDKQFREYIMKLKAEKKVVITGDMNVSYSEHDVYRKYRNFSKPGFRMQERKAFEQLLDVGFVDAFRHKKPWEIKYTYFPEDEGNSMPWHCGWRLDYSLVSRDALGYLLDSKILNQYMGSDHVPIKLTLNIP